VLSRLVHTAGQRRGDALRLAGHSLQPDRQPGYLAAGRAGLHDLQPEHAGPPELGRVVLRQAQLPVAAVRSDPVSMIDAIKQVLLQSGASWVLWFLGVLSLVSLVVIVERWQFYRSRGGDLEGLARALDQHLSAGDVQGGIEAMGKSRSVAAAIAA